MPMTPAEILQKCMRECGSDPDAGLTAFEYIMSNGLDIALLSHDVSEEKRDKDGKWTKGGSESGSSILPPPKKIRNIKGESVTPPRKFFRATSSTGSPVKTGDESWDNLLFAADNEHSASSYGDNIREITAKPEAQILYEGSKAFRSIAKGISSKTSLLEYSSEVAKRAKDAGYHAVWFLRQGDVGTAILDPSMFHDPSATESDKAVGKHGTTLAHDVSDEARDKSGKWTKGGTVKLPMSRKQIEHNRAAREKRANTRIPDSVPIPDVLYIAMPGHVANKALKEGHTGKVKGILDHEENRHDSVYLATDPEIVKHYAGMYEGSKILQVKVSSLDRDKLYYDANEPPGDYNDERPGYVAYRGHIPPSAFTKDDPTESAALAFDIHSRRAQSVLNRTIKAGKNLSKKARTDLADALGKAATDNGTAIIEFIEEYRLQLAQLLTTTQLSALLEGAREVMGKIPDVKLPGGGQGNANPGGPGLPQDRTGTDARDTGGVHYPAISEAAKGLAGRGVLSPDEYETLEVKAKAKAFTVAGVDAEQTLSKIRDTLAENVREGEGHEAFRKRVLESVDEGTFLNDAHLETVFRTNVQTAYSDGQETVLQHPLIRSGFPYRAYDAIHDDRVRDNHLALEKLGIDGSNIYRADDPVWQMFRPPWDYNDRCSATPVTVRQAAEAGVKEAKEWLDTGVEPYPPTFVDTPGFRPPEGFQRAVEGLPLSIRLSMQPMATFSEDTSTAAVEEETDAALLYGQVDDTSAASSNAPDSASTDTSRDKDKDGDKKKTRGKKNKRKRGVPRALRVKQEWLDALDGALSLDVSLGQWITVGGEEEPETGEKHHGGFHVYVDGSGRILKGRMKGKNVRNLKSSFDKINKVKVKGGKSGGRQRPNEPGKPDQSGAGASSRVGSGRTGGGAVPQRASADSGVLEGAPQGSGSGVPGEGGQVKGKPPGAVTPEPGPGTGGDGAEGTTAARPSAAAISAGPADVHRAVAEVTDKLDKVNARMERYGEFFRAKGQEQVADWLGMLQEQVNEVGIDRALDMLGEERLDDSDPSKVAYKGSGYFEEGKETDFIRAYLDRAGIALQTGAEPIPGLPIIASAPIPKEQLEQHKDQYKDAVIATDTPLDDKLQESKLLPGLESTEDVSKLMGREVTALTPDVIGKLDQTYGKGKWIIKSYGDESYAGFGIFFPQRAAQIQQSAKEAMWEAKEKLAGYGYSLVRERKTGLVAGVRDANTGKLYRFNSEDIGSIPNKNVQKIAKWVSFSAPDEKGARLPTSSEESLKQKYGVSLRKDESGKFVGITDWYGRDLNFDSPKYAKFKENAEAVAYEVERVKAWEGVAGKVSFMAQPAFEAIGVTEEERALGVTWETSREGRVHVTVRDGKASVVPFATMARREDTMPAVFADDDIRAMERAAQEAIDGLPPELRTGQVYAPDVMKTKDGWRVVELNASVETGSSAWLESNPLVMDAVVSHFTGREPQHVKFMRNLLRDKAKSSRPGMAGKGPAPAPPIPGSKPGAAPAPTQASTASADPDEVNIGEPAASPQAAAPQQPSPQGTQQAAKSSPHASSVPEHAQRAFGAIDKHLQMSGVDDTRKDEYGKAAAHVMKSMSPTAAERFEKHVSNAKFVNSSEEVRESLAKEFELSHPEFAKQIRGLTAIGGAFGNTSEGGALILDGGYTEAEQKLIEPGGLMEGAKQAADIYAHEFSHAIDGPNHEISTSDDWLLAWHKELGEESQLKLTDYAEQNPEEGFAEFGRLMLSGKYPPETIKNIYPTCYAVWEKHGLTSGGAGQSMSFGGAGGITLDELFGERVEYPDKNGHADVLLQGNKGGAAMAFDPEQPRKPKGSKEGGQFAPKGKPGGVRTIKHGSLKVKFSKHTDKRIKGSRLKLINYKQQDVHSCGFVAALTLAHYLKTGKSPRDVLKAVRPSVNSGVDRHNLIGSLKKLGIEADYKTDLTIATLRKYVEEGTPVIVSVWPDQWISDHWTIVQGFEGDKIHLTNHKSLPLKLFKKQWSDMDMRGRGDSAEGLVCRAVKEGDKALATDAQGHKHKGKGEGGGQFTGKDEGGNANTSKTNKLTKDVPKHAQKILDVVSAYLQASEIDDAAKNEYHEAASSVISKMSATAAERFERHVKSIRFVKSTKDIKEALIEEYKDSKPEFAERVSELIGVGGSFHDGKLILDGGYSPEELEMMTDRGLMEGMKVTADIYAHEFTHAIDGPDYELSLSKIWRSAWSNELSWDSPVKLTGYGASKSWEGFAEFGRLIFTERFPLEKIKSTYPMCYAAWEKFGLINNP